MALRAPSHLEASLPPRHCCVKDPDPFDLAQAQESHRCHQRKGSTHMQLSIQVAPSVGSIGMLYNQAVSRRSSRLIELVGSSCGAQGMVISFCPRLARNGILSLGSLLTCGLVAAPLSRAPRQNLSRPAVVSSWRPKNPLGQLQLSREGRRQEGRQL